MSDTLMPLLRKLESEATLSNPERDALLCLPAMIREMRTDQDIVRDKDRPSHCCLLIEGWLCRYKILQTGQRQILSFHITGEVPDLQSLFLKTMDHNLGCATRATVGFIQHDSVNRLIAKFPRLGRVLWRETLIDAAIFREWITGLGCREAPQRIAHLFCELFARMGAVGMANGESCTIPLSQGALGDALGVSTVHVNRSLMELRGQGLIVFEKQVLTIPDWDRLKEYAGFDAAYLHLVQPEPASEDAA
jgi:CRP-like cAMP-binding protein